VTIEGRVIGARPGQQVVLYARSGAWWVQPLANQPYTSIQSDSTWKSSIHPGTQYAALLVEPGYRPPALSIVLPNTGEGVIAAASVDGEPVFWRTWWFRAGAGLALVILAFAAYRWQIRNIEERERQFRKLAENAPDIVMRFDSELRCRYVNPIIEEYTGLPPGALLGRTIGELSAFDKKDRYWEASLRRVFETGKAATKEFTFDTPKGERHFESRLVAEAGSDGQTRSVLVVTRDVTTAKRAEEALRAREESFRLIVDSIPGLACTMTAEGEVEFINQRIVDYTGWTLQELKVWAHLVHQDDLPRVREAWARAMETGEPYEVDQRIRSADGAYRWFRVRGHPSRGKDGGVIRWYFLLTDIDERRKADEKLQRSEAYLAEGQRLAHSGSWAWHAHTRDAFWTEEMFRILGYDPEKTRPTLSHFMERVHPEDRPRIERRAQMESAGADEEAEADFRIVLPDGTIKHLHSVARPVMNESGEVTEIIGTTMDVTDRKRAELLLASEKRVLEMVAKGDSLAKILESLCRVVEEQAGGVLASILLLEGDRLRHGAAPSLPKAYVDAIDGTAIGPSEGSCGTAAYHGKQIIVEDIAADPLWANYRDFALHYSLRACWSTPVFSSKGKLIATFAMYYREPRSPSPRDQEIIEQITHLAGVAIERKLAEDALQRSESYLAESQRLTRTGSWALNPASGETIYLSQEMFRIFGFDPQDGLPGLDRFRQRVHPEDRPKVMGSFDKAAREKADLIEDQRIVLPDGQVKHIHISGHPVLDETGELVEYIGTAIDVTDRQSAEEELRSAETRFRTFVDHATDALFVDDEWGRIIDVNRQACESLGYTREELIGMPPRNFDLALNEAFRESVNQRLAAGEIIAFETSYRRKDGTEFPVELHVRPFWHGGHRFALALARDITERQRAEEQRERLRQAQADLERVTRVTTMGELTASLAHEINQPIAAAITNSNTCLRWLKRDPPDLEEAREAASRSVQSATRAAEIIKGVRALFKKGTSQREPVDVNEVIREMIALLRNEADRYQVSVRTELGADLPRAMADRVQLQQVLTNLMLNGIEAMKEMNEDAELTIKSKRDGNGNLVVSVSDTGAGLTPEQADQIFRAFYTTKPDGTGMGLPISRSIIESHGGRLWATGNSGPGATFYFTLPSPVEGPE
jgi:PAS domain S-box-containing protein